MQKFTNKLRICLFIGVGFVFLLLYGFVVPEDNRLFIYKLLNQYYDKEGQAEPLKHYEINVTNSGFCRYRKVYTSGKEEFFAFNLSRFKSMDYYGDTTKGELWLHTKNDDVIVQTRRDKTGDIDTMSTYMVIPLKNINAEQLNELSNRLRQATQASGK